MQTSTIGTSVEGRPITMHRFGDGPVGTLIMGGIHGDETTAIQLAERLVELLQHEPPPMGVRSAIAMIPVVNPDGAAAGRRTNAHRVDLNRNFPAKNFTATRPGKYHSGKSASSEPETVAIQQVIASLNPKRIVSIHSIGDGKHCNNYDGPAEDLAKRMAKYNGYPVTATIGYPTPGSFGSWAGIDKQIPVITLDVPADAAWRVNKDALLEALKD